MSKVINNAMHSVMLLNSTALVAVGMWLDTDMATPIDLAFKIAISCFTLSGGIVFFYYMLVLDVENSNKSKPRKRGMIVTSIGALFTIAGIVTVLVTTSMSLSDMPSTG